MVAGNAIALTAAYRDQGTSRNSTASYVYTFSAALSDTGSTVVVTLPSNVSDGDMHVFDIELN